MVENFDAIIIFHIFGFGINATIFSTWIVMAILLILAKLATKDLSNSIDGKVSRLQIAMEAIVKGINDQIREASGTNPMIFMPMIGTFFLFIGVSNLLSIIPWFMPPTASLSTTVSYAMCVAIAMPYYGIKHVGIVRYLKKYIEPTPIMLPFNIIGDIASIFSLAVRLYGNVLSGCVIGTILLSLAPYLIPLPLQILGLLTGTIQAYIFSMLAIMYISSIGLEEENKLIR
ncbi:MAG: ATP synthase subunit a [Alphaproteobacteria bacterium ADurb.Bin438]|nr:MAG: ATP synthase subunit a [Alphaproteobacteria bacterium ADurb.Bin438]